MNLQEIKKAVNEGKRVHWASEAYEVVHDKYDQWFIVCTLNNHATGLTWRDGRTLSEDPSEFFIGE